MRLVPEMQDVYELEERCFWRRWNGTSVHEVPDPRTRWEGDVVWEVGEMWSELVELARELAGREVKEGRGDGMLPDWACVFEEERSGEELVVGHGEEPLSVVSEGYTSDDTTLV